MKKRKIKMIQAYENQTEKSVKLTKEEKKNMSTNYKEIDFKFNHRN